MEARVRLTTLLLLVLLHPAASSSSTPDSDRHLRAFIEGELRADPSLAVLVALEEKQHESKAGGAAAAPSTAEAKPAAPSEQSLLQIAQAKSRLASRVASYLAASAEPYNGLSEPSNNCRTLLNTWMATCVFG